MTAAGTGLRRSRRKQDLLLASRLARGQAVLAFDELAGGADRLVLAALRLRLWLSNPLVLSAGGAAVGVLAVAALRRVRLLRVLRALRWGWLAWRLWHGAQRLQAPAAPPRRGGGLH